MRLHEFVDPAEGNFDLVSVINWLRNRIKRLDLDPVLPFADLQKIMSNFDPSFDYDSFVETVKNNDTINALIGNYDEDEITLNLHNAEDEGETDDSDTLADDDEEGADSSGLDDLESDSSGVDDFGTDSMDDDNDADNMTDDGQPTDELDSNEGGEDGFENGPEHHQSSKRNKVNNLAKRAMSKL